MLVQCAQGMAGSNRGSGWLTSKLFAIKTHAQLASHPRGPMLQPHLSRQAPPAAQANSWARLNTWRRGRQNTTTHAAQSAALALPVGDANPHPLALGVLPLPCLALMPQNPKC